MILFLFFLKPLLYLGAFALGNLLFRQYGPHRPGVSPTILVLTMAATRLILGLGVGSVASLWALLTVDASFPYVLFGCGFGCWVLTAWLAFRKTPVHWLVLFAAVAEAACLWLDMQSWHAVEHSLGSLHFC